ncbi:DUF935 domain-containing protein [Flavobacterium sp. TR2]|uniref:DUF935 domain-containing protein n=1 Tax=Flavobacterium sp. TR2 TaxID=2977321 RepID=UPI0021B0FB1A|nr:DUF935 domain-containing protein [Flavobacterium sp. TR2]UWY28816.1 DUF935 domain-containing protein [Flavobacterium sp. TR2]
MSSRKVRSLAKKNIELAAKKTAAAPSSAGLVNQIAPVSMSRVRQDVLTWNTALTMARKAEKPKRHLLMNLYDEIFIDGLLRSQVSNRFLKSLAMNFTITDKAGKVNEELTNFLQDKIWVNEINKAILGTVTHAHSVVELSWIESTNGQAAAEPQLKAELIKRQNIEPKEGIFYPDYREDKGIKYREMKEYGTWIIEFGDREDLGLMNCAVPHVLFKRFAQSCWSELCEIAGIPPRVMKTDTQNIAMLRRAERMMKEMGAAAWFIIDENEKFEWAEATKTDGAVYQNLMTFCNNELSMLFNGAVMGQDTKNGSRSKEAAMQETLQTLVDSDLSLIEQYWNSVVIPALINIGVISRECVFTYPESKDISQLWSMVKEAMQHYEMDVEWMNSTFSLKILKPKQAAPAPGTNLTIGESFFV